jgi:hypothetical protein
MTMSISHLINSNFFILGKDVEISDLKFHDFFSICSSFITLISKFLDL